jgi:glycosyltransferase involved in cell wall biosynthesis
MLEMDLAIVVPCRDRLASLGRCLDSIARSVAVARQSDLAISIRTVVVNDRSGHDFAPALARDFPQVEIIAAEGHGPGAARNTGLKRVEADLYLLTDSDCVVAEDALLRAAEWHRGHRAPMAQGTPWLYQRVQNPALGQREEDLYRHMFARYIQGNHVLMIDPRYLLVAKEYFDHFPRELFASWITDASAEDRAVVGGLLAEGLVIDWYPAGRAYHEDPRDEDTVWRQKYRHGSGRIHMWSEPPTSDYLIERYFLAPVAAGNERDYVVPAHLAFLLGYRDACRSRGLLGPAWWPRFTAALAAVVGDLRPSLDRVEPVVSPAASVAGE